MLPIDDIRDDLTKMETVLAPALDHVYWIGGSPCSGKSSIAAALAAEFWFTTFNCDDAWYRHAEIADPERHPVIHRLGRATCDELWIRPVDVQVSEEIAAYDEEFSLILDDLRTTPNDRPVIVEGAALMPHLIDHLRIEHDRAIWLVPSPEFQRQHYARRDWRHTVLTACTDRDLAWDNWMRRDNGFARIVRDEAFSFGRPCITVDRSRTLDEVASDVRRRLGLGDEGLDPSKG